MSSTIIVLGVTHELQYSPKLTGLSDEAAKAKLMIRLRYRDELKSLFGPYSIQILFEEAKHDGGETIAAQVCRTELNNCQYVNVDMPPDVRTQRGIPPLYSLKIPGQSHSDEEIRRWHAEREKYMLE
jgi:hypothetical protein